MNYIWLDPLGNGYVDNYNGAGVDMVIRCVRLRLEKSENCGSRYKICRFLNSTNLVFENDPEMLQENGPLAFLNSRTVIAGLGSA